mmetsp:Transcript_16209/g.20084  ORF Transcript_16209/g.20084 Transcript_16209/m.20084 type:complete len:94 (-) Transcript_16209:261-542(-)|eukprot:CAMPEP_0204885494 /NCGR_PEP_ID=MMETSP1349-20130617/12825_1 /ASSEMBLY_ACC=CAM_ASM_000710 /TAXON_ID=215587 /ORGANISM="Aplanochytrium stocchinoi, Strain GSBS06" /LENGTH=93 /DNA_ID=CAMNT_0052046987 /DNA_START=312 /DNA_END=593 /DNA_ORIENTATION=+
MASKKQAHATPTIEIFWISAKLKLNFEDLDVSPPSSSPLPLLSSDPDVVGGPKEIGGIPTVGPSVGENDGKDGEYVGENVGDCVGENVGMAVG